MVTLDQIDDINFLVNSRTKYQMPGGVYHWENSDEQGFKGMCADQSIAKWERLVKLNVPEDDMRFAIVGVEQPGDHMILCVRYKGTWHALDIRYPGLMVPAELPYSWQKWGSDFNADSWTTVNWEQRRQIGRIAS